MTVLHLLHIAVSGNSCRVVFLQLFNIFLQHGSLLVFSVLHFFSIPFTAPSVHLVNIVTENVLLLHFVVVDAFFLLLAPNSLQCGGACVLAELI